MVHPIFKLLDALENNSQATLCEIALPSVAICWSDEMLLPSVLFKHPAQDRKIYHQIFAIRVALWLDRSLTAEDQALWQELQRDAPHWPGFLRLKVSDGIKEEQVALENRILSFLQRHQTPQKT